MTGQNREDIRIGVEVEVEILTNSVFHPHGIKVRLKSGQVGRVQDILSN